ELTSAVTVHDLATALTYVLIRDKAACFSLSKKARFFKRNGSAKLATTSRPDAPSAAHTLPRCLCANAEKSPDDRYPSRPSTISLVSVAARTMTDHASASTSTGCRKSYLEWGTSTPPQRDVDPPTPNARPFVAPG